MRCSVAFGLFLVAVSALSLAPSPALAQLGTSTWSLEVGTSLGAGNSDASFAIRRHSGSTSAIRFALQADIDKLDGDGERVQTGSPDLDRADLNEFHSLTLAVHYLRFAPIRSHITGTLAVGPVVQKTRSSFRSSRGIGTASFQESEFRQDLTNFGLDVLLGADWFFTSRLSLGISAGVRGLTGSGTQRQISRSGTGATFSIIADDLDVDRTDISTSMARIQLTAYL